MSHLEIDLRFELMMVNNHVSVLFGFIASSSSYQFQSKARPVWTGFKTAASNRWMLKQPVLNLSVLHLSVPVFRRAGPGFLVASIEVQASIVTTWKVSRGLKPKGKSFGYIWPILTVTVTSPETGSIAARCILSFNRNKQLMVMVQKTHNVKKIYLRLTDASGEC